MTREVSFPRLTEERMRTHRASQALKRDGASPSGALELLAKVVEERDWERLEDALGQSFAGRFVDYVAADEPYGLGFDPDQLRKVLEMRHPREREEPGFSAGMDRMRGEVYRLLAEAVEPARNEGGRPPALPDGYVSGTHVRQNSHTATAVLARLKRDAENDPEAADLARRVGDGQMTANAAARAKGWRKPRIVLTSPESVAAAIRRHMTADDVACLVALLVAGEYPDGAS